MATELAALDPKEVVLVVIAIAGIFPVVLHYRRESRWFVLGYLLLVVGAIATNLEALVLGDLLNVVEHAGGLMGSGIAFAAAAYYRRHAVVEAEDGATVGEDVAAGGGGEA